ncbi:MAG TPA: FAD:protein FMN transferase [Streptosporangiaceae bacterium]|nr:FAD:protein FMN transferase [Streptosporangiaceae bacterium]
MTQEGWTALGARVQLVVTDPARLEQGRDLLTADLAAAVAACDALTPGSELDTLNRRQTESPADGSGPVRSVPVSPLLAEAIAVALRTASLTNGDLDPTAGSDDASAATLLRPVPRWHQIHLDPGSRLLQLPSGVRLDLVPTARAWAADRAAARLASALSCGVLVGLGGDIAVAGPVPRGGWRIRIQEASGEPPRGPYTIVAIRDGGVATSATAARRRRNGTDLLRHISDPRTGLPAAPFWRAATVAAASCTAASAAAATAMIRGRHALEWLSSLRLPARLVGLDSRVYTVGGWPAVAA